MWLLFSETVVPGSGPPITLFMGMAVLVVALIVLTRSAGKKLIASVPVHWLVIPQIFRIAGGAFVMLFALDLVPRYWALTAGWGDVAAGVLAVPTALVGLQAKAWLA